MNQRPNRREFLRSAARYSLAGLVVGGGAVLVAKRGQRCATEYPCDRCTAFAGCGLDKATQARAASSPIPSPRYSGERAG